ncbi:MAG: hypothetical protein P9L88_06840 [Candidatus Tantalella remota]|nr:hypothetical protein [Candidatus Tantalella remota]
MRDENLLGRLRRLGFGLFEREEAGDVSLTLADMVRSRDLRFWEGFPVVLAASAEKGLFDHKKVSEALEDPADRSVLASLVVMSLALYKDLDLRVSWMGSLYDMLDPKNNKEYEVYLTALRKDNDLDVGGRAMSAKRLKTVFNDYFRKEASGLRDLLSAKEDLGLEYAMSQVFSPKQKELFLKKLRGEVLTKTEKEYYSRVVKKKVLALANTDLHRLSRELLGE